MIPLIIMNQRFNFPTHIKHNTTFGYMQIANNENRAVYPFFMQKINILIFIMFIVGSAVSKETFFTTTKYLNIPQHMVKGEITTRAKKGLYLLNRSSSGPISC